MEGILWGGNRCPDLNFAHAKFRPWNSCPLILPSNSKISPVEPLIHPLFSYTFYTPLPFPIRSNEKSSRKLSKDIHFVNLEKNIAVFCFFFYFLFFFFLLSIHVVFVVILFYVEYSYYTINLCERKDEYRPYCSLTEITTPLRKSSLSRFQVELRGSLWLDLCAPDIQKQAALYRRYKHAAISRG